MCCWVYIFLTGNNTRNLLVDNPDLSRSQSTQTTFSLSLFLVNLISLIHTSLEVVSPGAIIIKDVSKLF